MAAGTSGLVSRRKLPSYAQGDADAGFKIDEVTLNLVRVKISQRKNLDYHNH